MSEAPQFVDCRQVRQSFSRIAGRYGEGDFFAREIDRRMQERLDYVRVEPKRVLDLGCSRGASLPDLAVRYPAAQQLAVDLVPQMLAGLRAARPAWQRWIGVGATGGVMPLAANAAKLPLLSRSTDLIWSNLLLHWLDDPLPALAEAHRVLDVGGLLMFSTLGPDTLKELRTSFADGYAHTQRFIDMHDLGDMLVECGFADPVMDMEVVKLTYDSFDDLLRELQSAGSSCAMKARRHGLTGRAAWAKARASYETLRADGKLPASFEVVYGHAWKVAPKQTTDGRAIVSLDALRKKKI
ncbi:MAG: methyltransferase domain-containing protein [Dechloromonas sp.]|uniref:Malonyl-[acyl-carrier protein] O-methyltransferase n=1 Tax=Candidatus Dechloromonas phosphorivorans TaxID=2899244 RepID=A0A935K0G1_9RHOO|nr:methyltransferase domain-containing protein [Candidatus Dechloromonas phosphorivorans]